MSSTNTSRFRFLPVFLLIFLSLTFRNVFAEVITEKTSASSRVVLEAKASSAKPGTPGVYKVVLAQAGPYAGQLVLDLGFSNFLSLKGVVNEKSGGKKSERGVTASFLDSIKEGDMVLVTTKDGGKSAMYHFQKVYPEKAKYELRLNFPKNAVFGDESTLHTYNAWVTSVYDGDTFHAVIDLGFGMFTKQRIRLRSLDAPELESPKGQKAKEALEKVLMADAGKIVLKIEKSPDQHGRFIADVWVKDKGIHQELMPSSLFEIRES